MDMFLHQTRVYNEKEPFNPKFDTQQINEIKIKFK